MEDNNEEYKSYFYKYKTHNGDDIDGLNTLSGNHKKYISDKYLEDHILSRIERTKYVDHVNTWLNSPLCDDNGNEYNINEYDDVQRQETGEVRHALTNQSIAKCMYDDVVNIINSSGFEIDDNKQFKEDFIHFIYTLSDIE